jgi:hypothetical protein
MRNRIKAHIKIRAGDLVPHELNPRTHNDTQREALSALYEKIGFARSLLAYELPDGRLKLIDGHLRQSMDPNAEVEVEVLDVSDEEARTLLLSIDPLAQLAGYSDQALATLRAATQTDSPALANLWASLGSAQAQTQAVLEQSKKQRQKKAQELEESYKILITCENEQEQVALLRKLKGEGISCTALIS